MSVDEKNDLIHLIKDKSDDLQGWQEAYEELQGKYNDLRIENQVIVKTVIKSLHALGMWPVTDNMDLSKLGKKIPGLIIEAMMPGSNLKEKFSFIKDIIPIAEKYKDIDINDL